MPALIEVPLQQIADTLKKLSSAEIETLEIMANEPLCNELQRRRDDVNDPNSWVSIEDILGA